MSRHDPDDAGTIAALMVRFREYRLPRVRRIMARVDAGMPLTDHDIGFLLQTHTDCQAWRPLLERHPEYRRMISLFVDLYADIVARGIENEAG